MSAHDPYAGAYRQLDKLRASAPVDSLDGARAALAALAEQRRAERLRAGDALMRDHARFAPTDARLCGDGGGGLLAESHSETVRPAAHGGQVRP